MYHSWFNRCLRLGTDIVAFPPPHPPIISQATMNKLVHMYFHIVGSLSLGQIASSGIAGTKEKHIFIFVRWQIPFHWGYKKDILKSTKKKSCYSSEKPNSLSGCHLVVHVGFKIEGFRFKKTGFYRVITFCQHCRNLCRWLLPPPTNDLILSSASPTSRRQRLRSHIISHVRGHLWTGVCDSNPVCLGYRPF